MIRRVVVVFFWILVYPDILSLPDRGQLHHVLADSSISGEKRGLQDSLRQEEARRAQQKQGTWTQITSRMYGEYYHLNLIAAYIAWNSFNCFQLNTLGFSSHKLDWSFGQGFWPPDHRSNQNNNGASNWFHTERCCACSKNHSITHGYPDVRQQFVKEVFAIASWIYWCMQSLLYIIYFSLLVQNKVEVWYPNFYKSRRRDQGESRGRALETLWSIFEKKVMASTDLKKASDNMRCQSASREAILRIWNAAKEEIKCSWAR
jgi:hypothetical protein